MKICTGPRYETEFQSLAAIPGWHGKFGHLNVLQLDHESACTGKGQHDRVVVYCPQGDGFECRVDSVWGLGFPTEKQVLAVARAFPNDLKGKWKLDRADHTDKGADLYFKRVN